jgi:hypothetical protein
MVGAIAMLCVSIALGTVVGRIRVARSRKVRERSEVQGRDRVLAMVKLKCPPGATIARIEHRLYFHDARNRALALEKCRTAGLEVSTAETGSPETYWLQVNQATLVDDVYEKIVVMNKFARDCGGLYDNWTVAEPAMPT